MNISVFN